MPAHRLSAIPPSQIANAVVATLEGISVRTAAERIGVTMADLDDAIAIYHTAGYAALEQQSEHDWHQVRVQFSNWTTAEYTVARELAPRLDQMKDDGILASWWFLRKHPSWRIRLQGPDGAELNRAINTLLSELRADGLVAGWQRSIYEPETVAFGGPIGIQIAHHMFCADSDGVISYLRQPEPPLGRRETSLLLAATMLSAVGLDSFERADVFQRIAQLRPTPAHADIEQIDRLATSLQKLLKGRDIAAALARTAFGDFAQPWIIAFEKTGQELKHAAAAGTLERGLRAVLSHLLIFHWNRLGLSAQVQGILAHTASLALLPAI